VPARAPAGDALAATRAAERLCLEDRAAHGRLGGLSRPTGTWPGQQGGCLMATSRCGACRPEAANRSSIKKSRDGSRG
jgi:hypothetical protein